MATRRSAEKEEFWRMVFAEQRESGKSVKQFCRDNDLSEPSFYAWRKKISRRDHQDVTGPTSASSASRLIPVSLVTSQQPDHHRLRATHALEIVAPSGFVFRFEQLAQGDQIASIVLAVELRRGESC